MVLLVFNRKQVIIDSFKHCELVVVTEGNKDLLIRNLKLTQPCATGLDQLKGLYYVVLQEKQDPFETSEELTHTYITKKTDHI